MMDNPPSLNVSYITFNYDSLSMNITPPDMAIDDSTVTDSINESNNTNCLLSQI